MAQAGRDPAPVQPVLCVLTQHPSEQQDLCGKDCAGFFTGKVVFITVIYELLTS